MNKRILIILAALVALVGSVSALPGPIPVTLFSSTASSSYTGPGDIVSGAAAWYGLRAYNGAYAAATSKAVSLRRASDNTTCDFNVATSGALGVSASGCSAGTGLSLAAFATTDATCTGTAAASTTLTVTGCSSTPHVGSTITGTGFTQPVYATAVSVAAGSGTITMNTAQTVTSASTTLTYGLFLTKFYDQSGNTNDLTQATAGNQPYLLPSCVSSLPCVAPVGSSTIMSGGSVTNSQPFTTSHVTATLSGTGNPGNLLALGVGTSAEALYAGSTSYAPFAGSNPSVSITSGSFYAIQTVFNAASSKIYYNGTNSNVNLGTTGTTGTLYFLQRSNGAALTAGYVTEVGLWLSAFSAGNMSSMNSNQRTYWGF